MTMSASTAFLSSIVLNDRHVEKECSGHYSIITICLGLMQESRSQALIRFAQRMQAKGRAATNMSKARGKSGAALAQGQAALPQSQGRAITDLSHTITGMKMSHRSSSVNRSQAQVAGASLVQESVKECEPAQFSGELLLHSLVRYMVC